MVKHRNYKAPFYTAVIDGFKSEVGSALVHPKGMIAVFDIESRTVSFRIGSEFSGMKYNRNTSLNCLDFAELFNGGGHPQAAGAMIDGQLDQVVPKVLSKARELLDSDRQDHPSFQDDRGAR